MTEYLSLAVLVVCQNASFTLVSRARNSSSIAFHAMAATLSNGVWLLVFRQMVMRIEDVSSMIVYLVASVTGSILMHHISMRWIEKGKRKVGSS